MPELTTTTTTPITIVSCNPENCYFGHSYLGSEIKRSVANLQSVSIKIDRVTALGKIESVVINHSDQN